jgi:hypothetical protein
MKKTTEDAEKYDFKVGFRVILRFPWFIFYLQLPIYRLYAPS